MKGVRIDPSLLTPADKEMLEDLIVAAFADAKAKADRAAAEKMQALTAGLPLAAGHEAAVLRPDVDQRRRAGNRAARPAARAPAGPRAALGAPRRAASHPQARAAARAARRGDARRPGADRHLLGLRQCRHPRSLHDLRRRAARCDDAGGRRVGRRSLGARARGRHARALSRARRRAVAARRRRAGRSQLAGARRARRQGRGRAKSILAVNATVDGQTTAHYIIDLLGRLLRSR